MAMTQCLSLRETYRILGGLRGHKRLGHGPVVYKNISCLAHKISSILPKEAKVAVIHLGMTSPIIRRIRVGATLRLKRDIIAARHLLQDLGYTHIAVTGPLLKRIRIDKRLTEISSHQNNRFVAGLVFSVFCIGVALVGLSIWPFQSHRNKTPGFLTLTKVSWFGFKNTVIYRL